MALPKPNVPVYEFTTHTGTVIKHSMTLMRDEKILAIAKETAEQEPEEKAKRIITESVVNVLKNVLISPSIETLTNSELEELFLHVRAVSNSNVLELAYIADRECIEANHQNQNAVELNILDYRITSKSGKTLDEVAAEYGMIKRGNRYVYMISDNIGITLQEPVGIQYTDEEVTRAMIANIFEGENVQTEFTIEEMEVFLEGLTRNQVGVIKEFGRSMPTVGLPIEIVCADCGKVRKTELKGISDFFG